MPFAGNEKHDIALADAAALTRNHRNANAAGPNLVKAVFFGKDALITILDQAGCVGVRCYFARTDKQQPTLVLVGTTADQNDMTNGAIMEVGLPCPPFCDTSNSVLNGG